MDPHEDFARPEADAAVDRAFTGIVAALTTDDPRFVRRVTRTASGARGNLAILVAVVTTLVLGVVPLAIGLQTGVVALLVVGALGCVLLPVAVPLGARWHRRGTRRRS